MSKTQVRVELKDLPTHAAYHERQAAFNKMFSAWKKAVGEAGIKNSIRQYSAYEKPGDKKRRKARQNQVARLKATLKENFPERQSKADKKTDKKSAR